MSSVDVKLPEGVEQTTGYRHPEWSIEGLTERYGEAEAERIMQ
ncbi:MAG TPA: hypothetical protein VGQ71_14325 [Terriglobales bacterium]|jgi:hypothetical protein|nr:hypothetical protein [Terriglobales bacterium]